MPTRYSSESVPVEQLLLDPNNYRFQDVADFVAADPTRFAEPSVQERATKRIRGEGLQELKASIASNGFLEAERLIVREYSKDDEGKTLYLVLEGNRRAASLKWLREDHLAGVFVPDHVLKALDGVPVLVTEADDGEVTYLSLMGIRHVGGIKEWGGYQRAKLVGELRDRYGLDATDVSARLGMTKYEVNRRYRALKALEQMEADEDYGEHASSRLYPLYHEAVSLPVVREWLDWNDESFEFQATDERRKFYALITPGTDHDGAAADARDPKITTYSQVRDLREILTHPEAKKVLLNATRTFGDALGLAKAEALQGAWRTEVAEAIGAIRSIPAFELEGLPDEDISALQELRETVDHLLKTHKRLSE